MASRNDSSVAAGDSGFFERLDHAQSSIDRESDPDQHSTRKETSRVFEERRKDEMALINKAAERLGMAARRLRTTPEVWTAGMGRRPN